MSKPTDVGRLELKGTLRQLLFQNLLAAAGVFLLLQIWRPFYFLTDDNFDGGFPVLCNMGQRLLHGQSPFLNDYLFQGNYNLLRDVTYFNWHPIYFLAALLSVTPAHFFIIDFVAFFYLMLAAAGFVCLAHHLRDDPGINVNRPRLLLFTLSFTYSMIVLSAGASWANFLGSHSALPWLALGILQKKWRHGFGLIALFSAHQILGGHLGAAVSSTLFLSLFAVGIAVWRKSTLPLLSWITGNAFGLVIVSPILIPALRGFLDTTRADGVTAASMGAFAMPATLFPFSYFFGVFSGLLPTRLYFGGALVGYSSGFLACAAAWALIPALLSRARWRGLEALSLGLVVFIAILVIRPAWMNQVMIHLPVLKSMRWPFREILQLQFFLHLFLILRPPGGPPPLQRVLIWTGVFLYVIPCFTLPPPTFNALTIDRDLLFSGRSTRYWQKVKPLLSPEDCIVPIASAEMINRRQWDVPYSLIGGYDFPLLFHVRTASGYSVTMPRDQVRLREQSWCYIGLYYPEQKEAILREVPNARFITLESVHPLRITLSARDGGPPIDVTPYLPPK